MKDADLHYVWVNRAFEELFSDRRKNLIGRLDVDVFKERQAVQCNGGDCRVLETGVVDEAYETVYKSNAEPIETITRKSRLELSDGRLFLIGVMHDVTEIAETIRQLEESKKRREDQSEIVRATIRDGDQLAQLGGEEFTVLLPGATVDEIQHVAERIRQTIENSPLAFKDREIKLTVSIGLAQKLDDSPFDLDAWLPNADAGLYQAKHAGRNRVAKAA